MELGWEAGGGKGAKDSGRCLSRTVSYRDLGCVLESNRQDSLRESRRQNQKQGCRTEDEGSGTIKRAADRCRGEVNVGGTAMS